MLDQLRERLRYCLLRKLDGVDAVFYRGQRDYNEVLEHELRQREGTIKDLKGDIDFLNKRIETLRRALWPVALKCALNDIEKLEQREAV